MKGSGLIFEIKIRFVEIVINNVNLTKEVSLNCRSQTLGRLYNLKQILSIFSKHLSLFFIEIKSKETKMNQKIVLTEKGYSISHEIFSGNDD